MLRGKRKINKLMEGKWVRRWEEKEWEVTARRTDGVHVSIYPQVLSCDVKITFVPVTLYVLGMNETALLLEYPVYYVSDLP